MINYFTKQHSKQWFIGLSICGSMVFLNSANAALMFSQYVVGPKNQKGLEIYNPDSNSEDLAQYEIRQYNNGAKTPNFTVKLKGNLQSQTRFLVGHSELKSILGDVVKQEANLGFNGDDAIVLYRNGVAIDRFGRVGERPANGWGNISLKNSFKRTQLSNDVSTSGIDPSSPFDLNASWEKWSTNDAYDQYLGVNQSPPEVTNISCSSADTPIANLHQLGRNVNYTVRGVITADYRHSNGFNGFFLQTPDAKAKPNLNNAVFVYLGPQNTAKGGKQGEEVILSGKLTEFQNQLQLEPNSNIQTCNQQAQNWIKPLDLNLPFNSLEDVKNHSPKRYQGMWVKIPQTLTISENYNYGRYGQLSLSLERLFTPTNIFAANTPEAKALAEKNKLSKIELDDGYSNQNRTPTLPINFSAKNTLRAGNKISGVEGILEYRFDSWRIQPIINKTQLVLDPSQNNRKQIENKQAHQTRVVAFNVLNYDNGLQKGFPTERGAKTKVEFDRQHAKIVQAMKSINADVYGLMEIANNGYSEQSAIANLTKALGPTWKFVVPPNANKLGDDAIAVAIIYNSQTVKPVNSPVVYDDRSKLNRVTMAQSFQSTAGGKIFTVIPNHLKSKGSCPNDTQSLDADRGDGQGCWNNTRVKAAEGLIQWIAKNPTGIQGNPNTVLLGDLNSYSKEDPILTLEKANYKNLLNDTKIGMGNQAYTYVFGVNSNSEGYGGAGNLDHALADSNLYPYVERAFAWHINADEPSALDYNTQFKNPQQVEQFYQADAYRSSDHDPVIVDLNLNNQSSGENGNNDKKSGGGSIGLISIFSLLGLSLISRSRRKSQI